jgi:hypothetical protein
MAFEHQKSKLDFFLHFAAASLVWFIYLPIVALVALQVSVLWRKKLLLCIVSSANFLAYAVMVKLFISNIHYYFIYITLHKLQFYEKAHLLWPTR